MKKALLIFLFTLYAYSQTPAKSLHFDGIDDYVNLNNETQTFNYNASSTFTIEFWIKPSDKLTSQAIIGKGMRTAGKGYIIRVLNNEISFRNKDVIIGGVNTAISTTNWSHVAVTYNATAVKIYINGVLKQTGTLAIVPVPITPGQPHKMFIGARRADNGSSETRQKHLKGTIDDLRFWSVVRTESEILTSKDCALVGTEANLVSYFEFNQGFDNQNNSTQTTLNNSTNTLYNGTLNSFALVGTTSNFVNSTNTVNACTLNVENITSNVGIRIYPNPTEEIIVIDNIGSVKLDEAIVTDINGKIIETFDLSNSGSNKSINIGHLSAGIYFITIDITNGSITKKLLKK